MLCNYNGDRLLEVWEPTISNWRFCMANALTAQANEQCPVVLIRIATGVVCAGLGQELALFEQAAGLQAPLIADYSDLRGPANLSSRSLRIVAWGGVSEIVRCFKHTLIVSYRWTIDLISSSYACSIALWFCSRITPPSSNTSQGSTL